MPHRQLPNSTPTVIRTLKTARDEYKNTPNAADRAISADLFAQLDDTVPTSLLNRLLGEASAVDLAEAAQIPLTSAHKQAATKLAMVVSHFHQVLDLGVARGIFSAGARGYYGRDTSASALPSLSSFDDVAEAADAVVNGEAARKTAEGAAYVPMALPSAAEVAASLSQFNALGSQSETAQLKTDTQRRVLNGDYPAALALAVDICDTVEYFYRKTASDATRRVQCQRWGVVYSYDNGSTPPPAPPAVK
jgi:hypothetical protein